MGTLIVASSEARVGRSLIAAATASRLARAGRAVALARLTGDESAASDAATFATLDNILAPAAPVAAADLAPLTPAHGTLVVEAPPGPVDELVARLDARVLVVGAPGSPPLTVAEAALAGTVVTRVPAPDVPLVAARSGVTLVLPEDRVLAAPSVEDIAAALDARWLVRPDVPASVARVMLGTIASDAATPYFAARERTCVVTRFDKTDVQLAALQTDVAALVLTGGRDPSPYLLDRVENGRQEVAVLLAGGSTPEAMRSIEPLYGRSRFDGAGKLERAVALLDEAGFEVAV
jgi:BioD-like phosphotransacetylase family protein